MLRNKDRVVFGSSLLFFFVVMAASAQWYLEWQDRKDPDRLEGIRGRLKKTQLELLSAAVLYKETPTSISGTSNEAHLEIYLSDDLDDDMPVFITVREFKRHYYWMQPKQLKWENRGWQPFSWPMEEVLKKLEPEPPLHQLGAVARIGGKYSRKLAPIILYQDKPPSQISAYRFIFCLPDNGDVLELKWTWYSLGDDTTEKIGEWASPKSRQPAGKPFYIDWKCTSRDGAPLQEGWYKLSVTGRLEYPSREEKIEKVYHLYHQPVLEVK